MRRAAKVDANHKQVVEMFRRHGCSVQSLAAVGAGVPDLLVGEAGVTHLVEVKDGSKPPSQRKLTPAQVAFRQAWKGEPPVTVESTADAVLLVHRWALAPRTAPSQPEIDPSDYERPRKPLALSPSLIRALIRAKGGA